MQTSGTCVEPEITSPGWNAYHLALRGKNGKIKQFMEGQRWPPHLPSLPASVFCEQNFTGMHVIKSGIFNSSSISLLFAKIPESYLNNRALLCVTSIRIKWVTTTVRWIGRRECLGARWGHPKWRRGCQQHYHTPRWWRLSSRL